MCVTDAMAGAGHFRGMMYLKAIVTLIAQTVLFVLGIAIAGVAAHFGGDLIAAALGVDEVIPDILVFFATLTLLGCIGEWLWPNGWINSINIPMI